MRKSITYVLASLSLSGASALHSQTNDQPPAAYQPARQEFAAYSGTYRFDNGETLTLWQQGQQYFGQLRGHAGQALLPKAPGEFGTSTGATIKFLNERRTVTVMHYEQLAVAPGESDPVVGLSGNTMVARAPAATDRAVLSLQR